MKCAAKMAAFPVSGARGARALPVRSRGTRDPTCAFKWDRCRCGGLSHVAGCEGAVEPGGGFGEFDWRQLEKVGCGADELGGDVASAAGAAHVVEGLLDGGHVEFLGGKGLCFHGLLEYGLVWAGSFSHPGLR